MFSVLVLCLSLHRNMFIKEENAKIITNLVSGASKRQTLANPAIVAENSTECIVELKINPRSPLSIKLRVRIWRNPGKLLPPYSICCLSLHHCHCLVLFGNGFLSFMTLISPGVRNVEGNPNFSSKTRMEDTLTMVLESFGSYNSEKSQYGHG